VSQPALYFFDMDHTLIANDCDVSWITFLVEAGLAPADAPRQAAEFFRLYQEGRLPLDEFFAFQLQAFRGRTPAEMAPLARRHFERHVRPALYPAARELVAASLATGRPVALLTATNEWLARPLAEELRIPHLLATRLEEREGRFTGRIAGTYCGGQGKVEFAEAFCRQHPSCQLATAAYYGDSSNDIPLLARVGFPHVVNPGATLRAEALRHGWPILAFSR